MFIEHIQRLPDNKLSVIESLRNHPDFDDELKMLLENIRSPSSVNIDKYIHLCRDLETTLRDIFPGCVVHPFGSTMTGLCFDDSDVDAFVELAENDRNCSPNMLLKRSRGALAQSGLFGNIVPIPKASTPIVKCIHAPTNLSCDFNFTSTLGVKNTHLVRYYLSLDPKLMPVMLVIKLWARMKELSGTNKFSSYSLTMMFVFYLQQAPYLFPSVHQLQSVSNCSEEVHEGWNSGFKPLKNFDTTEIAKVQPCELLTGFFRFCISFDYALKLMSLYLGTALNKIDFFQVQSLPSAYARYRMNRARLNVESPVCVQDPFDHARNITSRAGMKIFEDFLAECKKSVEILESSEPNKLYAILTRKAEKVPKIIKTTDGLILKMHIGPRLRYLLEKNDSDIVSCWYDTVNKFAISILMSVLKLEVEVNSTSSPNKCQKRDEQNDIHDRNVVDSVTFHCTSKLNVWCSRKILSKELLEQYDNILSREIAITNFMCEEMDKCQLSMEGDLVFDLVYIALNDPVEAKFILKHVSGDNNHFTSLCNFFAARFFHWFDEHTKYLNTQVAKAL